MIQNKEFSAQRRQGRANANGSSLWLGDSKTDTREHIVQRQEHRQEQKHTPSVVYIYFQRHDWSARERRQINESPQRQRATDALCFCFCSLFPAVSHLFLCISAAIGSICLFICCCLQTSSVSFLLLTSLFAFFTYLPCLSLSTLSSLLIYYIISL